MCIHSYENVWLGGIVLVNPFKWADNAKQDAGIRHCKPPIKINTEKDSNARAHTHTHTRTHTHAQQRTHTHTHSLSLALSLTHKHTLSEDKKNTMAVCISCTTHKSRLNAHDKNVNIRNSGSPSRRDSGEVHCTPSTNIHHPLTHSPTHTHTHYHHTTPHTHTQHTHSHSQSHTPHHTTPHTLSTVSWGALCFSTTTHWTARHKHFPTFNRLQAWLNRKKRHTITGVC